MTKYPADLRSDVKRSFRTSLARDKQVQAGVKEETVLQCDGTPCTYMYTYLIVLLVDLHPSNKLI